MRKSGWIVVGAAAVALAGCASSMEKSSLAPSQRGSSSFDEDAAYVAYVERVALRRGINVTWVNKPRRGTAKVATDPAASPD